MQLFVLQRENKMNTFDNLQSQQHFNWFRLDSDDAHKVHTVHKSTLRIQRAICKRPENCYAHKVHKCTSTHSNIGLYHSFKELSIKLLIRSRHCVLHNAVSYLNKGLPSAYLGRGNNNTFLLVQNFTRDTLPRKNLIIAQIHKSGKGMLLQYSGAALVRDADIEMAK